MIWLLLLSPFLLLSPAYSAEREAAGDSVREVVVQSAYGADLAFDSSDRTAGRRNDSTRAGATAAKELEAEIVAVPLPAAFWLFGSGWVGFVMLSNRRSV
jgi:hypothetical protein